MIDFWHDSEGGVGHYRLLGFIDFLLLAKWGEREKKREYQTLTRNCQKEQNKTHIFFLRNGSERSKQNNRHHTDRKLFRETHKDMTAMGKCFLLYIHHNVVSDSPLQQNELGYIAFRCCDPNQLTHSSWYHHVAKGDIAEFATSGLFCSPFTTVFCQRALVMFPCFICSLFFK